MIIKKVCPICGMEFGVPHWRANKAKYCSVGCQRKSLVAKRNVVCSTCGKPFHLKESGIKRYSRTIGIFCSKECLSIARSRFMSGDGNHQYGLRGELNSSFKGSEITKQNNTIVEIMVYSPGRPDADIHGRVTKHRLIVEENYNLFPEECFDVIDGYHVIKGGYEVHHIDGDHSNNDIENLALVSKSSHTSIHNRMNPMPRDGKSGRFIKKEYGTERVSRKSPGDGKL